MLPMGLIHTVGLALWFALVFWYSCVYKQIDRMPPPFRAQSLRRLDPWRRECWMLREHGRYLQFFRCDSTCLGFVKEKGASAICWALLPKAQRPGRSWHVMPSLSTSTTLLAGQCLPCQDGTYILGGGGKECTPCPSGTGFCPGKNIVIPERGHWQAQRCRSA
jgi:hypothetical protein